MRPGFLVENWTEQRNRSTTRSSKATAPCSPSNREPSVTRTTSSSHPTVTPQEYVSGPAAGGTNRRLAGCFRRQPPLPDIAGNNGARISTQTRTTGRCRRSGRHRRQLLTPADLTQSPSIDGNKNVAEQNLFYLNNAIHDQLYRQASPKPPVISGEQLRPGRRASDR